MTFGGVPDGDTIILTKSGLAELAGYVIGLRSWVQAAAVCLGPEAPK